MSELTETLWEAIINSNYEYIDYNFEAARKHYGDNVRGCLDFEIEPGKKLFEYIIEKDDKMILLIYKKYFRSAIVNENNETIEDVIKRRNKEAS